MAHLEQLQFIAGVKLLLPDYFLNTKVLEVGSLNINGSVRIFFESPKEYIGLDVGPGPGVDVVCEGQLYDKEDNYFDVAISSECFEHNPYWVDTFKNMVRMVRPGGLVVFTCATTGRQEHGTTRSDKASSPLTIQKGWEYYKNLTREDFYKEIDINSLFENHHFSNNLKSFDLYFYGIVK